MNKDRSVQDDAFAKTTFFAPFFGRSTNADSVYRESGMYWKYVLSHLYRYNAKGMEILGGFFVNHREGEDHGFFKVEGTNDKSIKLIEEETSKGIDSLKVAYIHKFIDICHSNNIKLVFMISPRYSTISTTHYDALKDIARKNDIPFLDYHTDGLFLDHPEYFKDNGHMQEEGARAFTSVFASDLKRVLSCCTTYDSVIGH